MKKIRLFLALTLAIIPATGVYAATSLGCQSQRPKSGLLDEAVRTAKMHGQTRIQLDGAMPMPRYDSSFEEATKYANILVATELAQATSISKDRDAIFTWHKFILNKDLSARKMLVSSPGTTPAEVPRALLPLNPDEIVVRTVGGTQDVDGVTVQFGSTDSYIQIRKSYLLILNAANPDLHVFSLDRNFEGIFQIGADGDTLAPAHKIAMSNVQKDVESKFGNSLSSLEARKNAAE